MQQGDEDRLVLDKLSGTLPPKNTRKRLFQLKLDGEKISTMSLNVGNGPVDGFITPS